MLLPESPRALVGDGALVTWAGYVAAHGAAAVLWALTAAVLLLRAMILWRQWRTGK
jgi:hypothetical protein